MKLSTKELNDLFRQAGKMVREKRERERRERIERELRFAENRAAAREVIYDLIDGFEGRSVQYDDKDYDEAYQCDISTFTGKITGMYIGHQGECVIRYHSAENGLEYLTLPELMDRESGGREFMIQ